MKAQELRLGNYVNSKELDLNNGGEVTKPVVVDGYVIHEMLRGNICDKYFPILLTEEWLLKFGFVRFDNLGGYCKEDDDYNFVVSKTSGGYDNDVCLYVIQYVHRLQNLYFALTGEELTANNKK